MSPKKTVLCQKGFSLIELSIVLVVMGLLMTAGVGLMRSVHKSSKLAKEKANITMIKNSLISYAFSHGRLPPTDCTDPPCELPYIDLNISSVSKDTWSLPYGYDVTDVLTTTNSNNLCLTLYQLNNLYEWAGKPPNAACGTSDLVCVTNKDDTDDGDIDADGQGYYLAAYVLSGGEDRNFSGKNSNDDHREYEMSSNPYVADDRDDLVGELSFGELMAKICNANDTTIKISSVVPPGTFFHDDTCNNAVAAGGDRVALGKSVYYGNTCNKTLSFNDLAKCDAGFPDPATVCTAGDLYDGKVEL